MKLYALKSGRSIQNTKSNPTHRKLIICFSYIFLSFGNFISADDYDVIQFSVFIYSESKKRKSVGNLRQKFRRVFVYYSSSSSTFFVFRLIRSLFSLSFVVCWLFFFFGFYLSLACKFGYFFDRQWMMAATIFSL